MQGVRELHARGWCHSDLKLDNIKALSGPGPLDFWVIIIDFGGAQHIRDGEPLLCVSAHVAWIVAYRSLLQSKSKCLRILDFAQVPFVCPFALCVLIHSASVRMSCVCPRHMRLLFITSSKPRDLLPCCAIISLGALSHCSQGCTSQLLQHEPRGDSKVERQHLPPWIAARSGHAVVRHLDSGLWLGMADHYLVPL
jgi:serine/threonine protein kinase